MVELVRSSRIMVVTPTRINTAQQREGSIRTTWHVFRIEETLSNRSDGQFARGGRQSCSEQAAPGIVTMRDELAVPFIDVEKAARRRPPRITKSCSSAAGMCQIGFRLRWAAAIC
jgi:hypothetical protein